MATMQLIQADIIQWLKRHQWLVQNGFLPRYHAILGDTPYFLGSISKRFGKENAAPARYGSDGIFQRSSRGFMGKTWDGFEDVWQYQAWVTEWARLMLDFVYPNSLCMFFGGSRTYHRVAAGLEDAGWIVDDAIQYFWVYSTGFPKALDVEGYKTRLKPAYESVVVARAPRNNTYTSHFQRDGVGLLNVDDCRIEAHDLQLAQKYTSVANAPPRNNHIYGEDKRPRSDQNLEPHPLVRYPANIIFDEQSADVLELQSRGASRFFHVAKAATWEREVGLSDFNPQIVNDGRETPIDNAYQRGDTLRRNPHPTIKPIQLIEYLAKLMLPPIQHAPRRILVPFAGVGSEMIGACLAGWEDVTGIEREAEYVAVGEARLRWWSGFTSYTEAEKAGKKKISAADSPNQEDKPKPQQLSMFDL